MNPVRGLIIFFIALCLGIWWWRRSYQPSDLEVHYATLEAKQMTGNLAQLAAWTSYPVSASFGQGWGTTAAISPSNYNSPTHNRPGRTILNLRFPQPTGN